ncbi:MarR family winged helix-turn-helix transcriptional regulator [Dactylosporangium sp. CS-047395]|uniref:MarR family winged helix-turn-helix transcriptional regulator n=1 Tax=Dactylosporangium sp. CS-047395 TaxID=3239936 RepID=UPI003D94C2E0
MKHEEVRLLLERLGALWRRQRRERVPVAGLSQSAVRLLAAVNRLGGATRPARPTQPARLADETQMTSSNVAATLRELEAAGLVARDRDESDARRVNVSLTPAGADLVARNRGLREAWLAAAIDDLLTEREQRVLAEASDLLGRLAAYEPPR